MTGGEGYYWKETLYPEYVAVVLASTVGTRLFPLTSNNQTKHMLPTAGIPILYRLLNGLEACGFTETIITVDEINRHSIFPTTTTITESNDIDKKDQQVLHPYQKVDDQKNVYQSCKMKVTIVPVQSDLCTTNIEALRIVENANVIPSDKCNVVIFPGDLILLDIQPIKDLLHRHRIGMTTKQSEKLSYFSSSDNDNNNDHHNNNNITIACTVLLCDVNEVDEHGHPLKESAKSKKGLLSRDEEEIDYIAVSNHRLLWKQSKLDVEEDKDMTGSTPKFILPKSRLYQRNNNGSLSSAVTVRTEWNDVHCYCISPWVRKLIMIRTSLQSIQGDLIPLLISRQYRGISATFGQKVEKVIIDEAKQITMMTDRDHNTAIRRDSSSIFTMPPFKGDVEANNNNNKESSIAADDEYAVLTHIAPKCIVFRSNTIMSYLYANKEVAHTVSAIAATHTDKPQAKPPTLTLLEGTVIKPKFHTVILPDSIIGDKVTYKSTVIGRNCKLGIKCRLNNVVIHDNVSIGDNVILQNTIINTNVTIGENCNINDCQIASNVTIPSNTKKKGEAITIIDDGSTILLS